MKRMTKLICLGLAVVWVGAAHAVGAGANTPPGSNGSPGLRMPLKIQQTDIKSYLDYKGNRAKRLSDDAKKQQAQKPAKP